MLLIFALTVVVFFLLYLGPYRNPGWLSPGFAGSLCLFGIAAFSTGEFIREAVRKPFVVYNVVLGNQISPDEVPKLRAAGYLDSGVWTRAYLAEHYPQTIVDGPHRRRRAPEPAAERPHRHRRGPVPISLQRLPRGSRRLFGGGAVACAGRSRELVRLTIEHLEDVFFMPSWAGTPEEAELITDYLISIQPPRPAGMRISAESGEVK